MTTPTLAEPQVKTPGAADLTALENIQRRVLWLATNIVHHANNVRPNPDGTKVGGHQASSASAVSILTALYFWHLRAGDRVSIKPHASPAFHAVQYLLGNLDRRYLATLRAFGGLQSYPSRTKDPDPVDFSTGSMGLGVAAPAFAALAETYARDHFGGGPPRRFFAVLGDAELDEGNIWEAVAEDHLAHLGNLTWIIDLNRQSLDRVIPGIKAARLEALFRDSDWRVFEAKYGRRLRAVFERPGGDALRREIDDMSNEAYQAMIRLPGADARRRLLAAAGEPAVIKELLAGVPDEDLPSLLADLGGHDVADLIRLLEEANAGEPDRPAVIFAYTIKGWGLPMAAHPLNHSALLKSEQMAEVARRLDVPPDDEWAGFAGATPEGRLCRSAADRLRERTARLEPPLALADIPEELGYRPLARSSTQQTLGQLLLELSRLPAVAGRVVTVAPDVAVSTNLGGWINKVGIYSPVPGPDVEVEPQVVNWRVSSKGQHIELGISEMNAFLLLDQLGLGPELFDELLLPIGTVYDPFVLRGLDAFIHGIYSHSRFIVAGTPAGITLSPEGGAHQSTVTPALGIGLPNLLAYEPAFARELEWILMAGLRECLDREHGRATYLRLTTKPVDQSLLEPALARLGATELRRQVLAGGYRLVDAASEAPDCDPATVVNIAAAGIMVPEAVAAVRDLHAEGIAANVVAITSADRLYAATRHPGHGHLATLIPPAERRAPIVTVLDGASHTLAFLGAVFGAPVTALGVDDFGQSGSRSELYRHFGIDAPAIVAAAFHALDL